MRLLLRLWAVLFIADAASARLVTYRIDMKDLTAEDTGSFTLIEDNMLESAVLEYTLDVDAPGEPSPSASGAWSWRIHSGSLTLNDLRFELTPLFDARYEQERITTIGVEQINMIGMRLTSVDFPTISGVTTHRIIASPTGTLFDEIDVLVPPSERHTTTLSQRFFRFSILSAGSPARLEVTGTFDSITVVPAPGALATLVLCGLMATRRRACRSVLARGPASKLANHEVRER